MSPTVAVPESQDLIPRAFRRVPNNISLHVSPSPWVTPDSALHFLHVSTTQLGSVSPHFSLCFLCISLASPCTAALLSLPEWGVCGLIHLPQFWMNLFHQCQTVLLSLMGLFLASNRSLLELSRTGSRTRVQLLVSSHRRHFFRPPTTKTQPNNQRKQIINYIMENMM